MYTHVTLALVSASVSFANPVERQTFDNTSPVGTNPISISSTSPLGDLTADNSCSHRDLGFFGSIGGEWYAIYGDTLWCAEPVTDPTQDDTQTFHGMVRDSVSAATDSATKVHDLFLNGDSPVPHQQQFVPFNASWGEDGSWGFGGTSLCETDYDTKEGVIFYLRNANDAGLKGAGVGHVRVVDGTPQVIERYGDNGFWWDSATNPRYGDQLAYRDSRSEYIYAVGGAPTGVTEWPASSYSYATRVKASEAHDLSSYEYFWGPTQGWKSDLLTQFDSETAIFWGAGQGQIVWNEHYQCYIFVHLSEYT